MWVAQQAMASTDVCIHPKRMQPLIREVTQDFKTEVGFTPEAFACLQEKAEASIVRHLAAARSVDMTVTAEDLQACWMEGWRA